MSTTTSEVWDCSNEAYHSHYDHVSNSMKEVFRKSRALFHGRYIAKTITAPAQTDAMLVGSALHCAAGEPAEFDSRYVVAPQCDRRTKDGKAIYQAFLEASAGKDVLTPDQMQLVQGMSNAILTHPIARELINGDGPHEFTVRWQDTIPRMCRFDKLLVDDIVPDIKTAVDPSPEGFAKACASFGYHRQGEWYCDGYRAHFGREPRHVFIVVGKEPPHEVFCYELSESSRDLGREQNNIAIKQLAACYESGNWESPLSRQVTELGLPRWAFFNDFDYEG